MATLCVPRVDWQARFERHWARIMGDLDEQTSVDIDTSDLNVGPKTVKLFLSNPMFAALCLLHDWNRYQQRHLG